MINLRILNESGMELNTGLLDLPIIFVGNYEDCEKYAKDNNYKWKRETSSMWGGYWVNKDGDCLIPTQKPLNGVSFPIGNSS